MRVCVTSLLVLFALVLLQSPLQIIMACGLRLFPVVLVIVASAFSRTAAHTYHTGECPSVEPMSGFEMRQVSGKDRCVAATNVRDEQGQKTQHALCAFISQSLRRLILLVCNYHSDQLRYLCALCCVRRMKCVVKSVLCIHNSRWSCCDLWLESKREAHLDLRSIRARARAYLILYTWL